MRDTAMKKTLCFVIQLSHNRLSVSWGSHENIHIQADFVHPRTVLGRYEVLVQALKPIVTQAKSTQEYGRWWQRTPIILWLLPPQIGGVHELERHCLSELGFEICNGRCIAYVFESEAMSYAQAQAIIPTLKQI